MLQPPNRIYAKTEQGRAELASSSGTLDWRLRAALIVVNGQLPLEVLERVIGDGAAALIARLLQCGHIEAVDALADPAEPVKALPQERLSMVQQIRRRPRAAPTPSTSRST
jgi:hypothetical protein